MKNTETDFPIVGQKKNKFRNDVLQSNVITKSWLPFTKLESNLFCLILSVLQRDKLTYSLNVKQILTKLNINEKHYQSILDGLNGLYEKSIDIEDKNVKKTNTRIRLLSKITYDKVLSDEGYLSVDISHSIVEYLFDLKSNFTIFSLNSFIQLKYQNSKKLYTLLSQYKSIGKLIMTIDEIQKVLNVNYRDTPKLLYNVINPSIKEIEETSNIKNIKLHKIKSGRSITHLKFEFDFIERQLSLDIPKKILTDYTKVELYQRMREKYKLSEKQSIRLLENVGDKEIRITLREIQLNNKVQNIGPYTYKTFENKYDLI